MKILVVDDSVFMCNVITELLKKIDSSLEIVHAHSGKDALEKYAQVAPDLILLDIIMAEMGGVEVLKEIGKEAKIIVVSAVGQKTVIKKAMDLGALDYIVKPLIEEEAIETLKKYLK